MSNNELKPTDKEIAEYILSWIVSDEHEDYERRLLEILEIGQGFKNLRKMFAPVMYNSIEEWSKAQQDLRNNED